MRILKVMPATLILVGIAIPLIGCGYESDKSSESQLVTVQRGNLTIDITAVGNLALSHTEDLDFDIFYEEATVEEILVEEGDTVKEGQELAKLDISEWEEELEALEDWVTTAERDVLQKEINLKSAEVALERAEDSWLDTVSSGMKVRQAKKYLEWHLENEPEDKETIRYAQEALEEAWDNFFRVASDSPDAREVAAKEMEVELAQARLEDAQKVVEDAQKDLDEAKSKSPVIVAPFDGFITKINVEGGDEVLTGTVAVVIADPNTFEADILVSEMDILQVKLGGEAWVQVDAMQGMSLPAKVTRISPTATIQSGVVNYEVKVEIESFETVLQEQQEAGQHGGGRQAIPAMIPEDFQLREGLTVTVNILVDERTDVLLVPNSAITIKGKETYVQVMSPNDTTEERAIQTGISNWQYTEVTDGLSEDEKIIVPQGTPTTATTSQQRPPGMPIPGLRTPH